MARNCTDVAEAVLTSFDTSMNNAWREEEEEWHAQDREWHQQDLQWMSSLRLSWAEERAARNSKCRWREENMVQRNLENARCLWLRFVERNRRDVEEKSEQLKAISNLAALFAGFAIVTLTQFSVQEPYSMVLVSLYGVLTALVECLMTISMVTCTLILGCILKIGKTYVNEQAEEEFIFQCLEFCQNYHEGDHPPCPKRTLEVFWECRWNMYSRTSKVTATLFVSLLGIAVFIWYFVHYCWGKYVQKQQFVGDRSNLPGDCSGLPYDWYLAPNIRPTQ